MFLDVLGPVQVRRADGGPHDPDSPVDLGTPRQRAIVAALALSEGRVLPVDGLVERVWWGEDAPPTVMGTLQSYVGGLRRILEPDRRPRQQATVLVTEHEGYALRLARQDRDDVRLADAAARARSLLDVVPDHLRPRAGRSGAAACREALGVLEEALGSWRGEPYADLGGHPDAVAERTRLRDLRTAMRELRVVAMLALGRHDEVAADLEAMTRAHPLHERWWTLWAVALARAGRQADALAALQKLRSVLDDELGVEPSAPVRDLQTAILRQDPTVTWGGEREVDDGSERALDREPVAEHRRFRVSPPMPPWELVGRDDELAALDARLDRVLAGSADVVWVSGEAGIGKSRLVHELALMAFARGFAVLNGACSHVGAPELWPWRQVFTSLEQQTGPLRRDVDPLFAVGAAGDFATWDALVTALRREARDRPLLVVLEDVHEADASTLRLLQHVVATAADERLLVVATRRAGVGDDALLEPLTAAVARRGGTRIEVSGLVPDHAQELLRTATGAAPDAEVAEAWCGRAGGNPFFLVELALAGGEVSGSLVDVVRSRLAELPENTRRVLDAGAVVDVAFDEDLVAFMIDRSVREVAADVAPALAAGLLVEAEPVHRVYRFGHAVVHDVVRDGLPTAERNRLHARVAIVMDEHSGLRRVDQRTELAQHWELAGATYAAMAWRSLVRAAEAASADGQYREAVRLLHQAVAQQRREHGLDDRERHELLLLLIDAHRWAGDWDGVAATVDRAVEIAERMGDPELVARSAMSTLEGDVWQVRTFGVVHAPVIAALERSLAHLDAGGNVSLRARARMALATELYYGGDMDRVDGLVEEAVALAEESGDPRLRALVLAAGFSARWRSDTLDWRREAAAGTLAAAHETGDQRAQAIGVALVGCAALESGDLAVARPLLADALVLARRLGLVTVEGVLLAAEVPLRAMTDDDEGTDRALARLEELVLESAVPNLDRAVAGSVALAALWRGDLERLQQVGEQMMAFSAQGGLQMGHVVPWFLLRTGQVDLAHALFPTVEVELMEHTFVTVANASLACELGLGLDDRDLARRGYDLALGFAGRMASAGSASALGPVDGFLALGALALGDRAAARRHAAEATTLATDWGLPRYVTWLERERDRLGF